MFLDADVDQEKRNKVAKNSPQNVKAVWEQDDNSIGQLTSNFKQWSKDWTGIFFIFSSSFLTLQGTQYYCFLNISFFFGAFYFDVLLMILTMLQH